MGWVWLTEMYVVGQNLFRKGCIPSSVKISYNSPPLGKNKKEKSADEHGGK